MEYGAGVFLAVVAVGVVILVLAWMAGVRRRRLPMAFVFAVLIFNRCVTGAPKWGVVTLLVCGVGAVPMIARLRRVETVPFREHT